MITPTARLRPVIGALLPLAIIIFGAPWTTSQEVSAQAQEVFVSVMDASGEPVTDLTAEELLIQWDGMDCETLNLETLNWPVRLTIFVDNADGAQGRMNPSAAATAQQNARVALQNMREGLKLFLDEIPEEVEVGMATLAGRARFLTRNPRYTTDREALARAIDLMIPDAAAARFRDSLVEEAEALNDEAERQYFPVIVMLSNDGAEGSTSQQNAFERGFQRLIANQATIHTRLFTAGNPAVGHGQTQVAINLGNATQGTFEQIAVSTGFRTMLPELGRDIARKHRLVSTQYRVTYAPPDGASDQPAMGILTSRQDVTMIPTVDGNVP